MQSEAKVVPQPFYRRTLASLAVLAEQRWSFIFFLLALNALVRPYSNITHDTRLYSVQVLNFVENGSYGNDLFFRFGSQDQYSLFSPIMAPLVRVLGLDLAFFVVYLVGNSLLIAGMWKLVNIVVSDRIIGALALMYMVTAPLNFGGMYIFHVHESFLTPRLLAVASVTWGLVFILQGRYVPAAALMTLGMLTHPLMAFGGVLIWLGCFTLEYVSWRRLLPWVGLFAVAGLAFLANPDWAGRFLSTMDDNWRENIRYSSPYNFASEWDVRDWVNIGWAWVALLAVAWLVRESAPRQARLYLIVAGLGVAAVIGTCLTTMLPYALLLQGQPYRALWILKLLQVPLGFLLIARLWQTGALHAQVLALAGAVFFFTTSPVPFEWYLPLYFLPIALVACRGLGKQPRYSDWLQRATVASLLLGGIAYCGYKEYLILGRRQQLLGVLDWDAFLYLVEINVGPLVFMLTALALVAFVAKRQISWTKFGYAMGGLGLATQLAWFVIPNSDYFRQHCTRYLPDILFARDVIAAHRPASGKHPTIYCPIGHVEYIWLEMRSDCYFEWCQAGGFIFRRDTAMEGQRRAKMVGAFEVDRFRDITMFIGDRWQRGIGRMCDHGFDDPEPTVADLHKACQDPLIDFLVLKQEFPGLFSASNGRVFVYDCRQVRAALDRADATQVAAVSPAFAKDSP